LERSAAEVRRKCDRASALLSAVAVSASARSDLSNSEKDRSGWRRVTLDKVLSLNNHEVSVESTKSYNIAGVYSFGRGLFRRASIEGSQTSYKVLHHSFSRRLKYRHWVNSDQSHGCFDILAQFSRVATRNQNESRRL
jgi:hypothetical protein